MAEQMPASATAALTVACSVPGLFTFFCPPVSNISSATVEKVRLGQAKAAVCSLVLGAAGSAVSKSPWPFLAALAIVAVVIWQYESEHKQSG